VSYTIVRALVIFIIWFLAGLQIGFWFLAGLQIGFWFLAGLQVVFWFLAGLQIVFNLDEVSFIQNLVFYIESAYCVPVSTTEKGKKGKALCRENVWGNGCIDPRILDLGTSWR
jgi:hypothetical protein